MSVLSLTETRTQDSILATTLANVSPEIVNNAIDHHPGVSLFFGQLANKMFGRVDGQGKGKKFKSGESIEVRARLGSNSTARALTSSFGTFSQDTADNARVGRANWRLYGGTIIISGEERRNNRGSERISSLLAEKTDDAVTALIDLVAVHLFNGAGAPSTQLSGFEAIISSNDTLQNFSGATYAPWNSRGVTAKGTTAASISFAGGSFATDAVDKWRLAWVNAEEGMMQPDVLLTTDLISTYYEGALAPEVRFQGATSGDLGFRTMTFKGKPVFHDPHCPSGTTYFLNFDHLYAAVSRGADFDVTQLHEQEFQDAFSAKVLFQGNLVSDMRKAQNKTTGQTA